MTAASMGGSLSALLTAWSSPGPLGKRVLEAALLDQPAEVFPDDLEGLVATDVRD
jgi:hypothetical protein